MASGGRLLVSLLLVIACAAGCKMERVQSEAPVETAPVVVAPMPTVPPIAPVAQPEGLGGAAPIASPSPSLSASAKPSSASSVLEKANEAATEGRSGDVRRLLEAKVRAGHGSPEEVRLIRKACSAPFDKHCIEDIKRKYP